MVDPIRIHNRAKRGKIIVRFVRLKLMMQKMEILQDFKLYRIFTDYNLNAISKAIQAVILFCFASDVIKLLLVTKTI